MASGGRKNENDYNNIPFAYLHLDGDKMTKWDKEGKMCVNGLCYINPQTRSVMMNALQNTCFGFNDNTAPERDEDAFVPGHTNISVKTSQETSYLSDQRNADGKHRTTPDDLDDTIRQMEGTMQNLSKEIERIQKEQQIKNLEKKIREEQEKYLSLKHKSHEEDVDVLETIVSPVRSVAENPYVKKNTTASIEMVNKQQTDYLKAKGEKDSGLSGNGNWSFPLPCTGNSPDGVNPSSGSTAGLHTSVSEHQADDGRHTYLATTNTSTGNENMSGIHVTFNGPASGQFYFGGEHH